MIVSSKHFQAPVSVTRAALVLLCSALLSLPVFAQRESASVASLPDDGKLLVHDVGLMEKSHASTFIVGLMADGTQVERLADALREDYGVVVHKTWTLALAGLLVESDLATAKLLAADNRVRFVEQNAPIAGPRPIGDQEGPARRKAAGGGPPDCYDSAAAPFVLNPYPAASSTIAWGPGCPDGPSCIGNWGLDRIDDRQPGLDGTYQPLPLSGPHLVDVFIIDTTVYLGHQELIQTPKDQVFTFTQGSTAPQAHGTHVAGIVAGKTFGVARDNIRFHSVSFGTAADFSIDGIVTGFELVLANRVAGVPAVVSLSANGPTFPTSFSLSSVVRRVVAEGISVVNSAGNLTGNVSCDDATDPAQLAENFTLAGVAYPPEVLIVGATNDQDRVYCDCDSSAGGFSPDCGSRLASAGKIDLFAPGADIVSMSIEGSNAICRLSGTSMAAPHVAGAAALLLSRFPEASPRAIHRALKVMATQAIVRDHNGALVNDGRLLYVGDDYTDDWPVSGHKWYFAEAGDTLSIPKSDLVQSSFDWEHRPLQITVVDNPWNGQLIDRGSYVDFTVDATAQPALDAFASAGFRFHVSNGVQVGKGKVRIVIQPNEAPEAVISVSGANLEHTFDGRGSTDDKGIVSYLWEFPDGVVKTGPVVSHFFTRYHQHPTFYETVKLTVTDAEGATDLAVARVSLYPQPYVTPRAGLWYNPDRSGHGISFYRNGADQYVLTWYTYLPDGTPIWYLSSAVSKSGRATWGAILYKVTRTGVSTTTSTPVGYVQLSFDDSQDAWFSWTLNGVSGGERFRFLHGGYTAGGLWFAPSDSGWGLTVGDGLSNGTRTMVNTITFYEGTQPRWVQGTATYSSSAFTPVYWHHGPGLCPSCDGNAPPTPTPAGSIRVEIPTPNTGTGYLSTSIVTPSGYRWDKPRLPIQVLTSHR